METDHLIPSFFIIGERKCGTSSLFRYLCEHPQILPGKLKEPNFFIQSPADIEEHFSEYLTNFPLRSHRNSTLHWPELNAAGILVEEKISYSASTEACITGEASANTMYEVNPKVLKRFLPDCKLIIILRDPVQRTFSHYRMLQRFLEEGRILPDPILEPFEKMVDQEVYRVKKGQKSFLLCPSIYVDSIEKWSRVYQKDQIRVVDFEDLTSTNKCHELMTDLFHWLGVKDFKHTEFKSHNQAPEETMPIAARHLLTEFFKPYNEALYRHLNFSFSWN